MTLIIFIVTFVLFFFLAFFLIPWVLRHFSWYRKYEEWQANIYDKKRK